MNSNPFDIAESKYKTKTNPFDVAESRLKGKPLHEEEFDLEREIERNQAQLTSRGLESVFGLPSDLANFAGNLFGYDLGLPGSEKLRELSESASGGYTAPKNEFEEKAGELFQDIATFAIPGAKHYTLARNLGIPVAAQLAKEGIKSTGGSETKANLGKLGSMIVLDILSHRKGLGTAKDYSGSLFQKADEMVPSGLSVKASNLEKGLTSLEESFKKGGKRPDTAEALEKIQELKNLVKPNGKIDLKSALAFRPSINAWIDKFKGFEIGGIDNANRKRIIHNLNQVKNEVIKLGHEYGEKFNPEFLKTSKAANESWAALSQSNKITNFIEKHASSKIKSQALKTMLGLGYAGGVTGTAALTGLGVGGITGLGTALGYKLFKTMLRAKDPTLRKHYFNILNGAAKGNSAEVIRNIKPLDNALLEMEETGLITPE